MLNSKSLELIQVERCFMQVLPLNFKKKILSFLYTSKQFYLLHPAKYFFLILINNNMYLRMGEKKMKKI